MDPMIYGPGNEKVAMAGGVSMPEARPMIMADQSQIKRTRKILVIILGICLAFSVMSAISTVVISSTEIGTGSHERGAQISESLFSILIYSFGIFVAHRYHVMGLRVFAWFEAIWLALNCIFGIIVLLGIFGSLVAVGGSGDSKDRMARVSVFMFILFVVFTAAVALTIVIVRFAFRLAKLIETFKRLNNQQI